MHLFMLYEDDLELGRQIKDVAGKIGKIVFVEILEGKIVKTEAIFGTERVEIVKANFNDFERHNPLLTEVQKK